MTPPLITKPTREMLWWWCIVLQQYSIHMNIGNSKNYLGIYVSLMIRLGNKSWNGRYKRNTEFGESYFEFNFCYCVPRWPHYNHSGLEPTHHQSSLNVYASIASIIHSVKGCTTHICLLNKLGRMWHTACLKRSGNVSALLQILHLTQFACISLNLWWRYEASYQCQDLLPCRSDLGSNGVCKTERIAITVSTFHP